MRAWCCLISYCRVGALPGAHTCSETCLGNKREDCTHTSGMTVLGDRKRPHTVNIVITQTRDQLCFHCRLDCVHLSQKPEASSLTTGEDEDWSLIVPCAADKAEATNTRTEGGRIVTEISLLH